MGSFDDLDDALLESVLKWLNSTELRNTACLVCKRWRTTCVNRPGLWRELDIDVAWEVYQPQGPGSRFPAPSSRAVHRADGGAGGCSSGRSSGGGRGRNPHGRRGGGGSGSRRPQRPAFFSRAALSRWLQLRNPRVEVLRISRTETRVTVAWHGPLSSERHDLQPSDLTALLASLPEITELHLDSACNLLPDPSALLHQPQPPGPPPAAAAAAAQEPDEGGGDGGGAAAAAATTSLGSLAALPPPRSLAERLTRLSLCRAGYDFQDDEGAAQAAALGGLVGLTELNISLEPAAEEGLTRLPSAWSALTGLTALRLVGHQRLRRLPRWLPGCLTRLRDLTLDGCSLRQVPVAALAGLRALRLLSLDRCPLGRGSPAVSLDAWWPPEEEGEGGVERGGGGGAAGPSSWAGGLGGDGSGPCGSELGSDVGRGRERGGGGGGIGGLEVLQLRNCDILALPYTMTRLTNLRRLELCGNPLGELALPLDSRGRGSSSMRASVMRYLAESGDRGFGQLAANTRLGHLGLEHCGLAGVPLGVPELTQLTSLDLSHNPELDLYGGRVAVVELPGRLPRLTALRLAGTAAGQQLRETCGHDLRVHTLILD